MQPPPRCRRSVALLGALVVVTVASACGSDDTASGEPATSDAGTSDTASSEPASSETVTSDAGAFPVTIEHAFGTSTIEEEPERVVVAGLHETDFLLSLGIAPVGSHEWWGEYPYTVGPWAEDVRSELGATPEVLEGFDVNVEWVASLDPDLIVISYHDIDQAMYDQLSEIAPVVAQHADYPTSSTPWREELRQIGEATGRSAQAEEVIAGVDTTIAQIVADHPSLAGATFASGGIWDEGAVTAYTADDVTNRVLAELGMEVPAEFEEGADGITITLSLEALDRLDLLDTFIWMDDGQVMEAQMEAIPTYTATRMHEEGRSIFPDRDLVLAMSFNTPLSIPYYLEQLAPMLDAAIDGDASS